MRSSAAPATAAARATPSAAHAAPRPSRPRDGGRAASRRSAAPRRISGPGRPAAAAATALPRPRGLVVAPRPAHRDRSLPARLVRVLRDVPDSRLLDRFMRGRAWIPTFAVLLLGVVAVQVSMLRMNAGIGRSVQAATVLERDNQELRARISRLEAGDRIQAEAERLGLVMPAAGAVGYVHATGADARRAASSIRPPSAAADGSAAGAAASGDPSTAGAASASPGAGE